MNKKIQKAIDKKMLRRFDEYHDINEIEINLSNPLPVKKPKEFGFDRDDVNSFSYPVGINNTLLEKKSNGHRVHVLIDHAREGLDKVKIYSSNMNEWDFRCFPEIWKNTLDLPSGYYQAELAGMKNYDGFSNRDEILAVKNRPKLNYEKVTEAMMREVPLQLNVFDALRIGDEVIANITLNQRRNMLENIVSSDPEDYVTLIEQYEASDEKDKQRMFLDADNKKYEGLVAKDPHSLYLPGSRTDDWLKIKDFLTLDLAVLGFYDTEKSLASGKLFSGMLVGAYNTESGKFETVSKVTAPKMSEQEKIYSLVEMVDTDANFDEVVRANDDIAYNPKMQKVKRKIPNRVVVNDPRIMPLIEVQCLNVTYSNNFHSCGNDYGDGKAHSIDIGTYKQIRDDKIGISGVNTTQELHEIYTGFE
ncbi:hypothetical protein KY321_00280 [Candidatus Woesearchaeota archaeon]|nr:hypothetical protein [Candidatus Woesearchaeota archaeon]